MKKYFDESYLICAFVVVGVIAAIIGCALYNVVVYLIGMVCVVCLPLLTIMVADFYQTFIKA